MSILKRGRATPKRAESPRGRKRKTAKRADPAQRAEIPAAPDNLLPVPYHDAPVNEAAATAAAGLRSAIAEVDSRLDEALRCVADLKVQATAAQAEDDNPAAAAVETAAAEFARAVDKVDQVLAATHGAAAREAAAALQAFHRQFEMALQDVADQQRGAPPRPTPLLDDVFGKIQPRRALRAV